MQTEINSVPRRGDGAGTRAQILETAGQLFAEKGHDRVTGREITEQAGTNPAAINYYFGGFEGLYAEVLVEAHKSVASVDVIAAVAEADTAPEAKLRQLIAIGVDALRSGERSWALRVLSREFLAPTPAGLTVEDHEIVPKLHLVNRVVAEVLGRAEHDPVVDRCCFNVMSPITMLYVCEPSSAARAFPSCCGENASKDALVDHLFAFALGGLRAAAATERP